MQNYFETIHKCRSYGPGILSSLPFNHLNFKCDIDLQPTSTSVSYETTTPQGEDHSINFRLNGEH